MGKWTEVANKTYKAIQKRKAIKEEKERLLTGSLDQIEYNRNVRNICRR